MAFAKLPESAYDGFTRQDYLSLLDDVRFKALRFAKLSSTTPFSDLRAQS
ncbi:hypothetical protein B0T26DRAFT_749398 [Lasiosphaeria miniovina]|uniref:Uncharacterized protein n=1 Tax=Lasiosphaeria miniovina TaxID=1954250 RepID=A0AA40ATW4_9PEZI|nr:uncharacterized protein B0T26DRAFT_749398 [Lasiosphaeria miniovina]KAK0721930.1 hypothetical protein B0T26DRAFT_749398 [Lasiosphaeria miniovina]